MIYFFTYLWYNYAKDFIKEKGKMTKRSLLSKMLLTIVLTFVFMSSLFVLPQNAYANSPIFLDVKNSSFENTISDNSDKPFATDWTVNNGNFDAENINVISNNAYDKDNYWQFKKGNYSVESEDFIDVEQSAEYIFGVKFIFSNIQDSCAILVKGYNVNGELISTNKSEIIISKSEYLGMWQESFLTIYLDTNVKKIKISIEIDANVGSVGIDNVYAHKNFIKSHKGASISLERDVLKIRFTAEINYEAYQTFVNNFEDVSVGMVFAPKKQVTEIGEYTIKGVPEDGNMQIIFSEYWNNEKTCQQDGLYTFSCYFAAVGYDELVGRTNILFVVRPFIKFTQNGEERVIYSSWNIDDNCRSIKQVAQLVKQDVDVYNSYDLDQQEIISAFIEGRIPNFDGLD